MWLGPLGFPLFFCCPRISRPDGRGHFLRADLPHPCIPTSRQGDLRQRPPVQRRQERLGHQRHAFGGARSLAVEELGVRADGIDVVPQSLLLAVVAALHPALDLCKGERQGHLQEREESGEREEAR